MPTAIATHGTKAKPSTYRPSPCKRGYGRRWERIRIAHLSAHPLCADCAIEGRITAATEVDHVDGDVTNNDESNHRSLCKPHHSRKTCANDGGLGLQQRNDIH